MQEYDTRKRGSSSFRMRQLQPVALILPHRVTVALILRPASSSSVPFHQGNRTAPVPARNWLQPAAPHRFRHAAPRVPQPTAPRWPQLAAHRGRSHRAARAAAHRAATAPARGAPPPDSAPAAARSAAPAHSPCCSIPVCVAAAQSVLQRYSRRRSGTAHVYVSKEMGEGVEN